MFNSNQIRVIVITAVLLVAVFLFQYSYIFIFEEDIQAKQDAGVTVQSVTRLFRDIAKPYKIAAVIVVLLGGAAFLYVFRDKSVPEEKPGRRGGA